ncbi:MAG: family 20 glycosylhydrolase, partial [Muribaculaceae bacterium]|nr:family 20 glycosylhydrolase [Muribaculaceae bacterium]
CEMIPTDSHAEYMLYPRMIALAEVGWTPQDMRDWDGFYQRARSFNADMRRRGYNAFDIETEVGNRPESYEKIHHLAYNRPVSYSQPWHKSYPAGGTGALVDGKRGGWSYSDKLWQGFEQTGTSERIDVTIDLGYSREIKYIGADFMQITVPDVWMPSRVEIYAGDDPESLSLLTAIDNEVVDDNGVVSFRTFGWNGNTKARYVRYKAMTPRGFLFTDEIIVE